MSNDMSSKNSPIHRGVNERRARTSQRLGAEGEARAAAYLRRRGYRIIGQNVRPGGVEIDLIAQRGRLVIFVEVKTRRSDRFGAPEEAVDARKQARLTRGAREWLRAHPGRAGRVRFDVIACRTGADVRVSDWQIHHIEGAFEAGD
jgi:putative endonuclease